MAVLAHSGSEDEFDPSSLPDPDKYKDSDEEQDTESEDSYRYVPIFFIDFEVFMFFRNWCVYILGTHYSYPVASTT